MELVSEKNRERGTASGGGRVLAVALCLASFLGAAALLDAALPRPDDSALTTKLDVLEGSQRDVELLFVGSSTVYRHVDPALFERVLLQRGHPMRTYNMGVPAMAGLETLFALERILDLDLPDLKWIVLDAHQQGHVLAGDNHLTARVAWWHDLPTALLACRMVWQSEQPLAWRLDQLRRHVVAFCYRLGNVGRLRELIEPVVTGNPSHRADQRAEREADRVMERGRAGDGFAPLEWAFANANGLQRSFLVERRAAWEKETHALLSGLGQARALGWPLRRHDGELRDDQTLTPAEQELLSRMIERIRARDIRLVFLNSPDVRQIAYLLRGGQRSGLVDAVLDLDDPEAYPTLFKARHRFDRDHLNEAGAQLYTRALAELFVRHLEAQDSP